ncbi:hypothetical protein WKW80_22230 [Variovorax humicola]|uniref:Peptidase S8/S53 domain-containing protein n=1 Tax=Variovorax humicola TaxID=1769758 RepID=A0ABU8W5R8_9BURK
MLRCVGELHEKCDFADLVANQLLEARLIEGTRFFSGRIRATAEALEALNEIADFVLAEPGMWPVGAQRSAAAPAPAPASSGPRHARCPQKLVVGVIDGACGFANRAFCAGTKSRIDLFWDQGGPSAADPRWEAVPEAGYGRQLGKTALDNIASLLDDLDSSTGADDRRRIAEERSLYSQLQHATPADSDWSHGTHVLGTILSDLRNPANDSPLGEDSRPAVIYVQLPDAALRDTSGRWAAAYVLDGIQYILDHASEDDDARIVINLSLGAFAGPHDGSSILERAMDELATNAKYKDRLTLVVAAGNGARVVDDGTGVPKSCHARFTLDASGGIIASTASAASLAWDIDVQDTTESFVELWMPELAPAQKNLGLNVTLEGPGGLSSHGVAPGKDGKVSINGDAVAVVVNATGARRIPNGNGGMVLVAIGHTRDSGRTASAPAGRWQLTVTNNCDRPLTIDAWIERRDLPGELAGFRPQYGFVSNGQDFNSRGSLGTLANGRHTFVVGAADETKHGSAAYVASPYSSAGLEGNPSDRNARQVMRRGPDAYGAGERDGEGFFTGSQKSLAGTSVAAAQLTAAVAWVTAQGPAAKGLRERLGNFASARRKSAAQAAAGSSAALSGAPAQGAANPAPGRPPDPAEFFLIPPRHQKNETASSDARPSWTPKSSGVPAKRRRQIKPGKARAGEAQVTVVSTAPPAAVVRGH